MFRLRVSVLLSLAASSANISQAAATASEAGNKTAASAAAAFVVAGSGAVRSASGNDSIIVHSEGKHAMAVDVEYPGTAVERMLAVRKRVNELTENDLNGEATIQLYDALTMQPIDGKWRPRSRLCRQRTRRAHVSRILPGGWPPC